MRVVYLHQYFVTPDSPGGTRSYEMARRLVQAGHEVHVVTAKHDAGGKLPRWRMSREAGISVHSIGVPYSNQMSYARRVWAFIVFGVLASIRAAAVRGDVIFATSTPLTIAVPARFAAAVGRTPYVFEVRDLWPKVPIALGALRNPVVIWAATGLERWAYRGAGAVVALAPGMAEHVVGTGYPSERVRVIPNGCDMDLFMDDEGAADLRCRHRWLQHRRLVVYAGTLGLVNGVDWLVEVAAEVMKIDPEVRFMIIGDGRESETVRRRAEELGVMGQSLYFAGPLPKTQTAAWVRASDAAMSLIVNKDYLWENAVTNKFFDALAAGRPVLSNHPGFQTELAVAAGAGAMLDSDDHRLAAEQLVQLLGDEAWLSSAAHAAEQLARERFDRDKLALSLEDVLLTAAEVSRTSKPVID